MNVGACVRMLAFAALICAREAIAEPWLLPGDTGMRSDLQLLADAGVLRGPVTTWPISWPDVARDVAGASVSEFDEATAAALSRVQRRARAASWRGFDGLDVRVAGTNEPVDVRGFGDSPRAEGEMTLRTNWLGDYLAFNAQVTYAANAEDGKSLRADGSYIGINIGNFVVSAGYFDRWWGPGWEGSLILSTNARPIPSLTLERNYSDPFKTRLLSWLGPWRASIAVGEEEGDHVAVANVRFLAARVTLKPRPWFELGLSRTAQWCGGGRVCGFNTFTDMLLGRDNAGDGISENDEPGNQMAGYDARIRSPWKALPVAFYTQWIGEDEAGGLPSKFLGLFGLEMWVSTPVGALRMHAEYADTACSFARQEPQFNCAYRNSVYPQGYTYRGRVIGHSIDNDSRSTSFGAVLTRDGGDFLSMTYQRVDVNRDGGPHAISFIPADLDNVELRYARPAWEGKVIIGLGYEDKRAVDTLAANSHLRGFVIWQQGF